MRRAIFAVVLLLCFCGCKEIVLPSYSHRYIVYWKADSTVYWFYTDRVSVDSWSRVLTAKVEEVMCPVWVDGAKVGESISIPPPSVVADLYTSSVRPIHARGR